TEIGAFVITDYTWTYIARVAAAIFVPLLFSLLYLNFAVTQKNIDHLGIVSLETPAGMKLIKVLPDGSRVVLNSRSSITYSTDFGNGQREMFLLGEAFFEVAKDTLRPFIVHTGNLSTRALGTSF